MKRWYQILAVFMLAVVRVMPSSQVKAENAGHEASASVEIAPFSPSAKQTLGEYPEVCEGVRGYQDDFSVFLTLESTYPRHSYYVSSTAGLIETSVEMGGANSQEIPGTVLPPTHFNGFRQFTIEWANAPAQYYQSWVWMQFDPAMGERQVQLVVEAQIPGMMDCYIHLPWTTGFQEIPGCPGLLEATEFWGPALAEMSAETDPLTTRSYRIQSVQPVGSTDSMGEHRLYVPEGELEYDTWGDPRFFANARGGSETPQIYNGFWGWVSNWDSIPSEGIYATDYRVKFAVVPGGGRTVHLVYQKTQGLWLDCYVHVGPEEYEGLQRMLYLPYGRK